jgi:gamma-glutamylcyclotransferase (GGCT)/AIG2-like uncharacterized protein YtfP
MKEPIEETPYVFVYGTLMSGFGNNRLLKKSPMISTGTTEDKYILRASSLPFLVEEDGKSYVTGEIYEVTSKTLSNLDLLEGHPDWYKRKVITVIDELGDKYKAWAYFVTMSGTIGCETVESGDYREYLSEMSEVTM